MYTVTVTPDESLPFTSRKEAIRAARQASQQARHPVKVLRDDGNEQMVYQRGELLEATFVTADQRGRDSALN